MEERTIRHGVNWMFNENGKHRVSLSIYDAEGLYITPSLALFNAKKAVGFAFMFLKLCVSLFVITVNHEKKSK